MKILLVEDNIKLNEAIKTYLEDNDFTVEVTFNGVQAVSKVKDLKKNEEEYDVIIMDRMMPLKDGIEAMKEIKESGISSSFIILTAKDTVDDKVYGLASGADDYMIKPFNVKELIARIQSLYRRNIAKNYNNKSNNFIIQNNNSKDDKSYIENNIDNDNNLKNKLNFSFNLNSGEIIFLENNKEKIISLTQKEASIFKLLYDNEGNVINKDMILQKIWKESEIPSSRFVDVHVHNLRGKLLDNNFFGRVETVRGSGYKLILN